MTERRPVIDAGAVQSEIIFQTKVARFAEAHGWDWLHIPRSRAGKVWITRAEGTLARGWFDLLLVRDTRIVGVELKTEKGKVRPDQERVWGLVGHAIETYLWRPSDWAEVERVLS